MTVVHVAVLWLDLLALLAVKLFILSWAFFTASAFSDKAFAACFCLSGVCNKIMKVRLTPIEDYLSTRCNRFQNIIFILSAGTKSWFARLESCFDFVSIILVKCTLKNWILNIFISFKILIYCKLTVKLHILSSEKVMFMVLLVQQLQASAPDIPLHFFCSVMKVFPISRHLSSLVLLGWCMLLGSHALAIFSLHSLQ